MGRMYTVSFTATSVSAAQDLFQIESNTVAVIIHAVYLSQSSDAGDANSEALRLRFRRVTDALTNVTAEEQLDSDDAVAQADLNVNDTTPFTAGAETLHVESWNILTPFVYLPPPKLRIRINPTETVTLNLIAAPSAAVTMDGVMYFEEGGSGD